jgi:hypothetical protein
VKRWVASAIAIVVAISVTVWVRDRAPHPEDWQGPFLHDADVGEPVELRDVTLTVEGVDGGRGLTIGGGDPWTTGGVWLVVSLSVTTDGAPAQPKTVELVDEHGRTFAPTSRFNQPMTETPVQPGMVATGAVAFEVPFDLGDRVYVRAGPRWTALDAVTNVAVPIAADRWATWAADGSTVAFPRRAVVAA